MATKLDEQQYLLPHEAAQTLRRSERTLARMRAEGKGPRYHKCGARILYPRTSIDEWITHDLIAPVRSGQ